MKRVTGIGGFLYKAKDAAALQACTPKDSEQFAPSEAPFMVNYRVSDLHALVRELKAEGCNVLDRIDESEFGKFAWVLDPEGNKVEIWQPPEPA